MPSTCPYCCRSFPASDKVNSRHLAKCNPAGTQSVPPCLCGHVSTSLTQMKRHRQDCPDWLARDAKQVRAARVVQTCLDRYGVESVALSPDVRERTLKTNIERYGAANVFAKGSALFDKVQKSLEGKRPVQQGAANAFARPEVQAKIRQHWLTKHGVSNPQQVAELRARTLATNLERYGHEQTLAAPAIRVKIRATCEQVYGGPAPSCSPEVQAKQRQTNLDRYGVEWTAQDPEVRRKQLETMEANYGSHYFASDQGKAEVRAVLRERYGVENPAQMADFWEKAVATFQAKYGVDHPLQLLEFLEKKQRTTLDRYGWTYPFSHPEEFARRYAIARQTWMKNWGADHPMKNKEHALSVLEKAKRNDHPTLPERLVAGMCSSLLYTGNSAFWRWLPLLGHHKNPDFILPGPDPEHPKKNVTKVVEVFGDFWHSRMFTGKSNFEHEQELIAAFAGIGIECLILWESEIKQHPQETATRLSAFLGLGPVG